MGMERKPGPWVEIWELREHCDGTGIEPQTHIGMREASTARCRSGKATKLVAFAELNRLLDVARKET